MSSLRMLAPAIEATRRADGAILLRSREPLRAHARCVGDLLVEQATRAPDRPFLAERDLAGGWRTLAYRQALDGARAIGQGLLELGLGPARPLALVAENSLDAALLTLGAMHAGIPVAPLSPAYATMSRDFQRLRDLTQRLHPGAIYVADGVAFGSALQAIDLPEVPAIHSLRAATGRRAIGIDPLSATRPGVEIERAFAAITPGTVAKILFTSGSTGAPKGVLNSQRMLCSNQQSIAQAWPFLEEKPPIVVDWLPWSHTFGGNHNFNMVLRNGGTLYIDPGRPAPGAIGGTVAALREIAPTLYFNVPRGFDALLPFLEQEPELRARFFSQLDVIFYAAAALPPHLWQRLEAVAALAGARRPAMLSAWGSTETAPMATTVHFPIARAGVIGLPAPGVELLLAPSGDRLEMRVRGPNVTPGYWERGGGLTPPALDEEGFLPTGDAGRFEDPAAPERGVVFDGRIAENFKLTSGTWVSAMEVRLALVAACAPLVADAVIAGHDRDHLAALLVPNLPACRGLCGDPQLDLPALLAHPSLRARIAALLAAHNRARPASSTRLPQALFLGDPLSIDGGEITDKGYVNQRAVLTRRAILVEKLYARPIVEEVIVIE